jgi:Phosphotransferase enzyme family
MPLQETIVETTEYRLVLVLPDSRKILAINNADGYSLPSISVLQWTRPAQQLREAIHATWKLHVLILDFFHGSPLCAVAEVLVLGPPTYLAASSLDQLQASELSEHQRKQVASLLADSHASRPFNRVGWIDEAIAWLESETSRKLTSRRDIEQYNAGGSFALVRFHTEDGRTYWLKATGEPNAHEPSITVLLSKLCGNYLPELIASKPEWNAWLMDGNATSLEAMPTSPSELLPLLQNAVECMAKLQIKTLGHKLDLISAGAFDQGSHAFQYHSTDLFDYIEEAMSLQVSTKVPRLEKKRIQELHAIFDDACSYTADLPETIVHGDLNCGNILIGSEHCQFIDWCEAYVANPLISLQHLLLLNKVEGAETRHQINLLLTQRYLDVWATSCDPDALARGVEYMPILAAASALYGRGDWLTSQRRRDAWLQSYARTLARHMDRAALAVAHGGSLCA